MTAPAAPYSYLPNKREASNKRGGWKIYQNLIKGDGLLKGEGGFFFFSDLINREQKQLS